MSYERSVEADIRKLKNTPGTCNGSEKTEGKEA